MLRFSEKTVLPMILLAACRTIGPHKLMDTYMNSEIALQCRFSRPAADVVEIRYVLVNGSPHDIYAFTPLSDYRNHQFVPAPGRVYVQLSPNGLLTLSRQLWKTPENVSVYMPEVPFLTRVPAGRSLEETIRVPVPMVVNYPYLGAGVPEQERKSVHRDSANAVFTLGYVQEDDELKVAEVRGQPGVFTVEYGPGITHQKLLSCDPVPLKVSVMVR